MSEGGDLGVENRVSSARLGRGSLLTLQMWGSGGGAFRTGGLVAWWPGAA